MARFKIGSAFYVAISNGYSLPSRLIPSHDNIPAKWEYEKVYSLKIGETTNLNSRYSSLKYDLITGHKLLPNFDELDDKEAKNKRLFIESYVRLKLTHKYKNCLYPFNHAQDIDHFFFINEEKRNEAEKWVFEILNEALEMMYSLE